MARSGLFKEHLFPQVQGVAYLHVNGSIDGGSFVFYPDGPGAEPITAEADANTGLIIDGIKVIHGTNRFLPQKTSPSLTKEPTELKYKVRNAELFARQRSSFNLP